MWFWFCILIPFVPVLIAVLPVFIRDYKKKHKRQLRVRWIFFFIYIAICGISYCFRSEDLFILLVIPFLIVFSILMIIARRNDKREYKQQ